MVLHGFTTPSLDEETIQNFKRPKLIKSAYQVFWCMNLSAVQHSDTPIRLNQILVSVGK